MPLMRAKPTRTETWFGGNPPNPVPITITGSGLATYTLGYSTMLLGPYGLLRGALSAPSPQWRVRLNSALNNSVRLVTGNVPRIGALCTFLRTLPPFVCVWLCCVCVCVCFLEARARRSLCHASKIVWPEKEEKKRKEKKRKDD